MSGFKAFLLRGNLIEIAVAFIMAAAFAKVVDTFVAWLTDYLPLPEADEGAALSTQFINAVIAFVILAAVVYFFIVVPYTKARDRYFPAPEAGEDAQVVLLREIRDAVSARN
ncbi:MscL family protein [Nocardioides limicola]|uniref:MscL family protein n=1 Tax=Nocardioides limicola TaxID=2803368 RepID=UPI00193C2A16|nr:MscL family protein [Nocardioides sp. DJM-14]